MTASSGSGSGILGISGIETHKHTQNPLNICVHTHILVICRMLFF